MTLSRYDKLRDSATSGYYVRMVTNASGVADLYMVAKASPGMYVSSVIPLFDYSEFTPVPFPFLVWDPKEVSIPQSAPVIAGETGWSANDDSSVGSLDFDTMPETPIVQATVQPYKNCSASDTIYLVCNKKIVAGPFSPPTNIDAWTGWVARFIDTFCYSDSGPNAGKTNDVFFVVAKDGGLKVSEHNQFLGTGNLQQGVIPTGPLTVPMFNPYVGKINDQLVSGGQPFGVDIDLSNQAHAILKRVRLRIPAFKRIFRRKPQRDGSARLALA